MRTSRASLIHDASNFDDYMLLVALVALAALLVVA
jgi:hypothetical protein